MNPTLYYFVLALTAVMAANVYGVEVLDTDGNPMSSSSRYYVIPSLGGQGGGLTLRSQIGETCPLGVVQEPLAILNGLPVKFSNWSPDVEFVPESQNLNIQVDALIPVCSQSSYWRVDDFDEERNHNFIVLSPKPAGSEEEAPESFFKIEKFGTSSNYKFLFCSKEFSTEGVHCSDVGLVSDALFTMRLVLSDNPFLVRFKNAINDA